MATVEVEKVSLRLLVRALRDESDGKELRRDLVRGLRVAVEPAAQMARGSILSMGTRGVGHQQPGLRQSVAAATKVVVRTTGRRAGVSVKVKKSRMPRGFKNAPLLLNRKKGWDHPLFGDWSRKVIQRGKPGWFDDTLQKAKPAATAAAELALTNVARRISSRTRG